MADDKGTLQIISRKEAKVRGLKRYYTGRPCKYGHIAERYVAGVCIECDHQKCKKWAERNKDYVQQSRREWWSKNREIQIKRHQKWEKENREYIRQYRREWRNNTRAERNKYSREYYKKHAESKRTQLRKRRSNPTVLAKHLAWNEKWRKRNPEYFRQWAHANREVVREHCRNTKARRKKAEGTHTAEDIRNIYRLQRGRCAMCKADLGDDFEVDHIVPLAKGGTNYARNLQLLCGVMTANRCNHRKRAKDPIDFARSMGLLL